MGYLQAIRMALIFEEDIGISTASPACLHLYLEEVGRVDAPATQLAYSSIKIDQPILAGQLMEVTLMAPPTRPEGHYAVRAHLSLHGEVTIASDDYLTTQAYPLLSRGTANALNLAMRRAA
jgi:hypothetical protein